MVLPIYAYGSKVLREIATDIDRNDERLDSLINDLYETMHKADGVGLAAPQVGESVRIFVIDTTSIEEDDESLKDFKKTFINPKILEEKGEEWIYNEGCLSVPEIREDVKRKETIRIQYYDKDFIFYDEEYSGLKARIIQHEYDHLEGKVFTDHISLIRKRLLKGKLLNISKGKISPAYKMKYPLK